MSSSNLKKWPTISSLHVMCSENAKIFFGVTFPGKIDLLFSFWLMRMVIAIKSSTKFVFQVVMT